LLLTSHASGIGNAEAVVAHAMSLAMLKVRFEQNNCSIRLPARRYMAAPGWMLEVGAEGEDEDGFVDAILEASFLW
jgi:hypothetical protein